MLFVKLISFFKKMHFLVILSLFILLYIQSTESKCIGFNQIQNVCKFCAFTYYDINSYSRQFSNFSSDLKLTDCYQRNQTLLNERNVLIVPESQKNLNLSLFDVVYTLIIDAFLQETIFLEKNQIKKENIYFSKGVHTYDKFNF